MLLLYSKSWRVKGYIALEVLPEPIVPVIKKFWYKPDSGIYILVFLSSSKPINKWREFIKFLEWFLNFLLLIELEVIVEKLKTFVILERILI